jgi:hypothetical protein
VPDLIVHDGYVNTFGQNLSMTSHDLRIGDPFQLGSLLDLKHIADTTLVKNYRTIPTLPKRKPEVRRSMTTCESILKSYPMAE